MSNEKRKINNYFLSFERKIDDENKVNAYDEDNFKKFIKYVEKLNPMEKIKDFKTSNKIVKISNLETINKEGLDILKGIVLAGKYNHCPDYISKSDGAVTETNKKMDDAAGEKVHFMGTFQDDGIDLLFESRKSGASINMVVSCLNAMYKNFDSKISGYFFYYPIAVDDYENAIKSMKRIRVGTIYKDKEFLGSEGFNLSNSKSLSNIQEEVMITFKSKKDRSLDKKNSIDLVRKGVAKEDKITRVRIEGTNEKGRVLFDTLLTKKFEDISVKLDSKGLVDSFSIFSRMEEILGFND